MKVSAPSTAWLLRRTTQVDPSTSGAGDPASLLLRGTPYYHPSRRPSLGREAAPLVCYYPHVAGATEAKPEGQTLR